MRIEINGTAINVAPEDRISYEALVGLAGKPGRTDLTVVYSWQGPGDISRAGSVRPGQHVNLADGMIFDVAHTGNA